MEVANFRCMIMNVSHVSVCVCLSVCLSGMRWYCVKRTLAIGSQNQLTEYTEDSARAQWTQPNSSSPTPIRCSYTLRDDC